jgi:glutamate-1-semialdehyde 2,1-aminomutase
LTDDYGSLIEGLSSAYTERHPRSAALDRRARAVMVDGGVHSVRLTRPFPPRVTDARGAYMTDADGHRLLDFWQGHFANLLGHAPAVVTEVLADTFAAGRGLQLGTPDEQTIETAELLCARVHAEKLRFTTSGTLATMYAVMLARAFTGRPLVLKVAGGWHGAQPWGLKGVYFHPGAEPWTLDSEGLPAHIASEVAVTRFNDPEDLVEQFRRSGNKIACLMVEPLAGAGNFMLASPEYLAVARELTERYGALLVLDEVISAFRFCAGDLGALYGIRPDLLTVGKIIGGGMPVAAVAGRADVLGLCGRECGYRVGFSGGTYSAHPASLLAAGTMVSYLVEHEAEIYPRLATLGDKLRRAIEGSFAAEGVVVRCSGVPNEAVTGSSLAAVHFPHDPDLVIDGPHLARDPALCDIVLKDAVLQLALLLEDVYTLYGSCALSTAHTDADVERLGAACRAAARKIRACT